MFVLRVLFDVEKTLQDLDIDELSRIALRVDEFLAKVEVWAHGYNNSTLEIRKGKQSKKQILRKSERK